MTLISHPERFATEIAHFFYANSQHSVHPLEVLVWSKVSYILGIQHPVLPGLPEAQQLFFDHMWGVPLAQMIASLDGKSFPESPHNVQAWDMQPDGSYRRRAKRRANAYSAQAELLALLIKRK